MKKILGLDLGTNSIGWAVVNEADNAEEKSSIIRLGTRIINYDNYVSTKTGKESKEPEKDFIGGKGISPNAGRTLKRSARRNLQRYKLRRENLIEILKKENWITDTTLLREQGNGTTFETYRLRAKAAVEEITLEQFARVLLQINKKRGYKSSRKAKNTEEGTLIDGMEVAKKLYDEKLTPGQLCLQLLEKGQKHLPDFYRSDLQAEFDKIWTKQKESYPEILRDELKYNLRGKNEKQTWAICKEPFNIVGIPRTTKGDEQKKENFAWRNKALSEKMDLENLAVVLQKINAQITNSSGYLGAISDRSKELFFNKQTVGQYQMSVLNKNSNASLKNMVFYRQDYLDEFNILWEMQAKFHKELTDELKCKIRNEVISYQRNLKSQKGLISFCEFENHKKEMIVNGKKKVITIGLKVIPRSSPLFQEFKIWQILNNIEIADKSTGDITPLNKEEKEKLFAKLQNTESLNPKEVLEVLFERKAKNYSIENYKEKIEGNKTRAKICEILDTALTEERLYELWHLLYSWEKENSDLAEKLIEKYDYSADIAKKLSNITFLDDYGSLSAKAIKKILPFLKEGKQYDEACELAGYCHSKSSLTKEEIENKVLKDKMEILPKNSLRNPVVEKILNQMVNVINSITETYGKPDEIRIELARELKKSAKEREEMTAGIANATKENEKVRKLLHEHPFNISNPSRNDIVRYKLYEELAGNNYRTLYSDTYISQEKLFTKDFDIEHIIPQSRLFDDSFSNKTIEKKQENIEKGSSTAYDWMAKKGEEKLADYEIKIKKLFDNEKSYSKYKNLRRSEKDIPDGFIERDIKDTQYIAKKAKAMCEEFVKTVVSTTGSITDRLREDWQLVNIMQELNLPKYEKLGLVEEKENKDGQKIKKIKDWTKRNDHRHHAMDALTVAFTKYAHIQFFNHINSHYDSKSEIYGIKQKYFTKNNKALPPISLEDFRKEAKKQLENILISIKAKNKVVTQNINATKTKTGLNKKVQLTPRGKLHEETFYGYNAWSRIELSNKISKNEIEHICSEKLKEFIKEHVKQKGSIVKAFSDEELKKLYYNNKPLKEIEISIPCYTQRIDIEKVFTDPQKTVSAKEKNLNSILDLSIREILQKRLDDFKGDFKQAFSNLNENPIWLKDKNGNEINAIRRVTISIFGKIDSLHTMYDKNGKKQPIDFINTGNNHHVAIYRDKEGNLQENVVSFFEAVQRANKNMPIIDKDYNKDKGWQFLFTMKQNEYFVFPNKDTNFDPKNIDLLDEKNYASISPNLFRVQKIATKDYWFRHHLETSVTNNIKDITFKRISLSVVENIIKVRVNHIGQIISVGEY